jgi:hypothetical protein
VVKGECFMKFSIDFSDLIYKINYIYEFIKNLERDDNNIKLELIKENFEDSIDVEFTKRKDYLTLAEYNFFMDLKEKIKNSVNLFETEGIEGIKRSLNENFK